MFSHLNTYLSDALPVTVCWQWMETPVQDNRTVLHSALEIWFGNALCDQECGMYSQPGCGTKKIIKKQHRTPNNYPGCKKLSCAVFQQKNGKQSPFLHLFLKPVYKRTSSLLVSPKENWEKKIPIKKKQTKFISIFPFFYPKTGDSSRGVLSACDSGSIFS